MGNYDLYGNSYATRQEALNAEMAQCAEIDSRHTQREMRDMEQSSQRREYELHQHISMLEQRIELLEKITKHLLPKQSPIH